MNALQEIIKVVETMPDWTPTEKLALCRRIALYALERGTIENDPVAPSPATADSRPTLKPTLEEARELIQDMIAWGTRLGGWEAPVWDRAADFVQRANRS